MSDVALTCESVVKIYETSGASVQALRGVDLTAIKGTVTAVVGPSGSGKSTLMSIIAGLDKPTAGDVVIAGRTTTASTERQRRAIRREHVGYLFQAPAHNLIPGLTIRDQLERVARFRGSDPNRIPVVLDQLGIYERADHTPERLSGGEQQRAGLARSMLAKVALLVCDEPTSELDSTSTKQVGDLLRRFALEENVSVVVATHDPLVIPIADHILLLRDGTVQTETLAGSDLAVIDSVGRVQLPPELAAWFPERRARLQYDSADHHIRISPP